MKLTLSAGLFLLALPSLSFPQPIFDTPVNLGPKINTSAYEADPFWDGPRKRLYFVSTRDGSEDIWYADWTDTGWADPQPVTAINTAEIEHSPSVSPDGQKLYFVTFIRPGATNAWDIWVASWDTLLNDWETPVELPCPVNTQGTEFSGRIGPDGRTLYLYSTLGNCNFPQQSGLLYSAFDSVNGWSIPQSLGPNINNGNGADYASVSGDGKWLYFDRIVSDGRSIFVSPWTGTEWGPATDLRSQIGERAISPFIIPTDESLFLASSVLSGFGGVDIFVMDFLSTEVDGKDNAGLPRAYELQQNYPNPFNGETHIALFVSTSSGEPVSLTIYNVLGQPIRQLLKDEVVTGKNIQTWDGRDNSGKEVSSGVYFYKLQAGEESFVKKMVLLK